MSDDSHKPLSEDELVDAIADGDCERLAADIRFWRDRAEGWHAYAKEWLAFYEALEKGEA